MMWELVGYALSAPTVCSLFDIVAQSDGQKRKTFPIRQASVLAGLTLRLLFSYTPNKVWTAFIVFRFSPPLYEHKIDQTSTCVRVRCLLHFDMGRS